MARRLKAAVGVVLIALVVALFALWQARGWRKPAVPPIPRHSLRLGVALQSPGGLLFIAETKGFLGEEGLGVERTDFVSGKRATEAMFEGSVDAVNAADVPAVLQSFVRDDFRIVAAIGGCDNEQRVIARRDHGIVQPADLRGKRVATQKGSAVHFFLHLFLIKNGLSEKDVHMEFMTAEELAPALVGGRIDAFCMREPYISQASDALGEKTVLFAEPGLYRRAEVLIVRKEFLDADTGAVPALLRALKRAEQFARTDPAAAERIIAARLGITATELHAIWTCSSYRISAEQALLLQLEDVARWAMSNGLTETRTMPNYLRFLNTQAIRGIAPESVTLIR